VHAETAFSSRKLSKSYHRHIEDGHIRQLLGHSRNVPFQPTVYAISNAFNCHRKRVSTMTLLTRLVIVTGVLAITSSGMCRTISPVQQSNPNLSFSDFINGIQGVTLLLSYKDSLVPPRDSEIGMPAAGVFWNKVSEFFYNKGIACAQSKSQARKLLESSSSICDIADVAISFYLSTDERTIGKISVTFRSCNGDGFLFAIPTHVKVSEQVIEKPYQQLADIFVKEFHFDHVYDRNRRVKLPDIPATA
jgi:hypothetical protein